MPLDIRAGDAPPRLSFDLRKLDGRLLCHATRQRGCRRAGGRSDPGRRSRSGRRRPVRRRRQWTRHRAAGLVDARQHGADGDGLALRRQDLEHRTGRGRGNLGVHLVRGDLDQRLVALDPVAQLYQPTGNLALDDALSQRRQLDCDRHELLDPLAKANRTRRPAARSPPPHAPGSGDGPARVTVPPARRSRGGARPAAPARPEPAPEAS